MGKGHNQTKDESTVRKRKGGQEEEDQAPKEEKDEAIEEVASTGADVEEIADSGVDEDEDVKEVTTATTHSNDESIAGDKCSSYERYHYISLAVICVLTIATRLYQISEPRHICWDETHFGKFANHYLNGAFFMDVHPPLGKMLLALAGYVSGYNGTFPFGAPGEAYGDDSQFVGMRVFCAFLGGMCVPLCYLVVWENTRNLAASILTACFVLFDAGCVTISQYILLDPPLMFFMMMSVYSYSKFFSFRDAPFAFDWWGWLFCTGFFLACTFSVKFVGLFVILFAGLTTIADLWAILGDLSLSIVTVGKHLAARVLGLIILPIYMYLFFFYLHFQALPKTGTGDTFFSSAFQATLIGNPLYNSSIPGLLAYGSIVTIKNQRAAGHLLHSHAHLYPKEHPPVQQQVTGYGHRDVNNDWRINKAKNISSEDDELEYVKDGDLVRLQHVTTGRNIHTHREKAPLTTNLYQVSCYGVNGEGDWNDVWRIEVERNADPEGRILTVRTVFRLVHANTGCGLAETAQKLPKWGWDQMEIACNPFKHLPRTLWNIEGNKHSKVPLQRIDLHAPGFLESVYESHIVMLETNSGFKPKEGEYTSQAWHWPINYRGQVFSGADHRIYLLGTPVVWWMVLATLFLFIGFTAIYSFLVKRAFITNQPFKAYCDSVLSIAGWLLLGWMLHYLPFYAMGRVVYFHHYFPAYLFSAMFAGVVFENTCQFVSHLWKDEVKRRRVYFGLISLILVTAISSFYMFRGLSYGMSGPRGHEVNATQAAYKWLTSWDI